jgi:co-chaperonin GroES (HSP10)
MEAKNSFSPTKINKKTFRVLGDAVVVTDMLFDERITSSGIVLLNDNGKGTGIRPRWGQVYAVGPEQKDVVPGQWVCVAHGRWTRGLEIEDETGPKTIRKIDPKDMLLISETRPNDDTMSDAIHVEQKSR